MNHQRFSDLTVTVAILICSLGLFSFLAFAVINGITQSDWFQGYFFHAEFQAKKTEENLLLRRQDNEMARLAAAECLLALEARNRTIDLDRARSRLLLTPAQADMSDEVSAMVNAAEVDSCRQKHQLYQTTSVALRQAEVNYQSLKTRGNQ